MSNLNNKKMTKGIAGIVVVGYALLTMIPLVWIILTSFKSPEDAIAYPPKVVSEFRLDGYVNIALLGSLHQFIGYWFRVDILSCISRCIGGIWLLSI